MSTIFIPRASQRSYTTDVDHVVLVTLGRMGDTSWRAGILSLFTELAQSINESSTIRRQAIVGTKVAGLSLGAGVGTTVTIIDAGRALYMSNARFIQACFEEAVPGYAYGCPELFIYATSAGAVGVYNASNVALQDTGSTAPIARTIKAHGIALFPVYNNVFSQGYLLSTIPALDFNY